VKLKIIRYVNKNFRRGDEIRLRKALLFLKKKKQNAFYDFGAWWVHAHSPSQVKVFWFFFSKKNRLLAELRGNRRGDGWKLMAMPFH